MEGTLELKEKTEQLLSEEPGPRPRHGQVGGREGGRETTAFLHAHRQLALHRANGQI